MRDWISRRISAVGFALFEISECESVGRRTRAFCGFFGQGLIWGSALLDGSLPQTLHDSYRESTEPLFSRWGLDVYPRGYLEEVIEQHVQRVLAATTAANQNNVDVLVSGHALASA